MDVITLGAPFVEVLLALHMHQIKFIDETMPFEEVKGAIDRNPINARVELSRLTKNLRRIQMLLCSFDDAQNCSALMRQPNAARGECGLQSSRSLGLRQGHV